MKNVYFNRAWEGYVSNEISLSQKCVFNIFVLTIHIHIIQEKRRCKLNLLETNSLIVLNYECNSCLTLSLDTNPQTKRNIMKNTLGSVALFTEKIFYNCFGKNVLNKQLWWYVFVISKIEVIIMSTLSY